MYITVLTRVSHWSLLWARPIHSSSSYSISLRSNLILCTHPYLGLPNVLIPSHFPTNILHALIFTPFMLHALPCYPPSLNHSIYTWKRVQVMKFLVMQVSPISCHVISNTITLSSSFNIRDQVSRPYRTTGKTVNLCSNFYFLRQQTRKQKIMDWMVVSMSISSKKKFSLKIVINIFM
jgi:hypothetical protein